MSFSCPHFDINRDYCLRLKTDCVPGRPGCVLPNTAGYAVPIEERLRLKAEEKQQEKIAKILANAPAPPADANRP